MYYLWLGLGFHGSFKLRPGSLLGSVRIYTKKAGLQLANQPIDKIFVLRYFSNTKVVFLGAKSK